jgi:hypothetical protein
VLLRAANPLVRAILRSRLHPLLSGTLLLVSHTGRRTGREYTFPVRYFAWDDGVVVFSSARWWRHLLGGEPVRLLLRGTSHEARPTVAYEQAQVAERLERFAARYGPRVARTLWVGLPRDRQATRAELERAARRTAVVEFRLELPSDDGREGAA